MTRPGPLDNGRPAELSGLNVRLRNAMRAREVTVRDLSERTDRTEFAIRCWLTGARVPAADSLFAIARALGVSSDWLLGLSVRPVTHDNPREEESRQ